MASNLLRPEDWPEIVKAIQAGDPGVGSRLADRERRFDNLFDTFDYVPQIEQPMGTVIASAGARGTVVRLGGLIFIFAAAVATAGGTAGQIMGITAPRELFPTSFAASAYGGTFEYFASGSTHRNGRCVVLPAFFGAGTYPVIACHIDNNAEQLGKTPSLAITSGSGIYVQAIYLATPAALL